MSVARLALGTGAATLLLLAGAAVPAQAFHHVVLPANACGQSTHAGGANPIAVAALRAHNKAQDLPLPPVGTPAVEHLPDPCGD